LNPAYIIDAVRTPVGRRGGGLATAHSADLGGFVIERLIERSGVDPATVDDVVFGCIDQIGPQSADIARTCALTGGLPEDVPGVTVDRQCGSSQQAVQFAAQAVMSEMADVVVAGGVQNMSQIPIGVATSIAATGLGHPDPDPWSGSTRWRKRYGDQEISQFHGAEMMAERWSIDREEMERFALESHQRAAAAIDSGAFEAEIQPYGDIATDEGPRRDTTAEKMASLPTLVDGGRLTAAVSSQISDAASALLVVSERAAEAQGLKPRARIVHASAMGADPVMMLAGPIPATRRALERSGITIDDIDLFEINEAFACVPMAWERELGIDHEKVNVNGGAIALGHPLGATGTRIMATLLNELERRGGRYGLQTMCEGGGQANVTIIERLD